MNQSLTFTTIHPFRLVGASSKAPFCSIISENKLLYSSGNNIILQNTKNNQQKILYTHTLTGHIQLIVHHVTLYNQHLLAIALRDSQSLMNLIVIVSLNSAIFNLQNKKQSEQTFFLRHIEQYQEIQAIHFFEDGTLLGFVSNYGSITSFSLMKTANGDVLLHQGYSHTKVFMGSVSISKQAYVAVVLQETKDGVRLCLMATDQLSRRLYYSLQLTSNIQVISCSFESIQEDSFYLLALVQSGDILIYKVNDFAAELVCTITVNIKNKQGIVIQRAKGMQCAGNKLVVFYEQSKTISLIQFSSLNPNINKMVALTETLCEYRNIAAVHSLRISKDNCTVAGLFRLSSKTYPPISQNISNNKTVNTYGSLESTGNLDCSQFINSKQDEFVALQIDMLQNLIDFSNKKCNVEQTLSLYAGHAMVKKVQYCAHTNSLFLLLQNKTIKYYDLITETTIKPKTYKNSINKLQLWSSELTQQPTTIAAHPFNFSITLIYNDLIKFHHYNCRSLLPAHIVASIKSTTFAVYSPLGDKLILSHHSSLTIIDSYTYQIVKTIALNQPIASLTCLASKQQTSKMISAVHMSSFYEMMVLCGQNNLWIVSGWQKSVAFGNFEGENQKIKQMAYDQINKLTLVVLQDIILILSKPSLNSIKCSLVSKLELSASCILLRAQLGVLFIGVNDGSVVMAKWPHYQQQDLYYLRGHNRIYIFDQPIITIHLTSNMRYLYAISQRGAIAICQLQVADGEQIIPQYKQKLLKINDIPLKLFNCWLVSRSEQERKQREIIKLRGDQADRNSLYSLFTKDQALGCDDIVELKKKQFDQQYAVLIQQYEEQIGLKKVLQSVSLLKDEIRVIKRQAQREIANIKFETDNELNKHFQQTTILEKQYQNAQILALNQKQALKASLRSQLQHLKQDLQTQNAIKLSQIASTEQSQLQAFQRTRIELVSVQEDNMDTTQLMRVQFEEEKDQLLETAQVTISKNRNTNIAIRNLHNKMSEVGIEREKIEFDMFKVEQQKQVLKNTILQLQQFLNSNNVIYNRLIQKTRKIQAQLHQERKMANTNEYNLNKLLQQIDTLFKHHQYLDQLFQSVSSQFVSIKQQHYNATFNVQSLHSRLAKLKTMKNSKNYEEGLAKSRLIQYFKTLGRELQLSAFDAIQKLRASIEEKQEQLEQNELGRQFENLQAQKSKLSVDANKWIQIKDSYKTNFRRIYHKLNDQNIKLTYQYNDLLKVSQEYRIYLNYLTNAIADHSKTRENSKIIFKSTAKHNKQKLLPFANSKGAHPKLLSKKGIIKKSVCISLHEQSGKFITQA